MIKIDFSKTYGRVNWDFLSATRAAFGFAKEWIDRVIFCVKIVQYQIKFNGDLSSGFSSR